MPPLHLTLCVIVRDEAFELSEMLASTRKLWDECVVVDTGSSDNSPQVAADNGARVISTAWRDDFSEARNIGLEAARGRWILVLDCDERLESQDIQTLRQVVMGAADRVILLPQWTYTERKGLPDARAVTGPHRFMSRGASAYVEARQIRLFPCREDLRYAGNVHESLDTSVVVAGLNIECLEIPIHHHGHLVTANKNVKRNRLYGRMLRDKVRVNPEDPMTRYELGVQLANEGRHPLAERLLARTVRDAPGAPGVHKARLLLSRLLAGRGENSEAARQTAHAVRERPDQQACWVAAVWQHAVAGMDDAARRYLKQGLVLFPHDTQLNSLNRQEFGYSADNKKVDGSLLPSGTGIAKVGSMKPVRIPEPQAGRA